MGQPSSTTQFAKGRSASFGQKKEQEEGQIELVNVTINGPRLSKNPTLIMVTVLSTDYVVHTISQHSPILPVQVLPPHLTLPTIATNQTFTPYDKSAFLFYDVLGLVVAYPFIAGLPFFFGIKNATIPLDTRIAQ